MSSDAAEVTIVIPFLNESAAIPTLVAALDRCFAGRPPAPIEVLFVDDGSTDDSVAVLRRQRPAHFRARLIQLARNFGSHAALRAGVEQARGRWITFLCADLQDPPELVERMWKRAQEGYDVVWAQRENIPTGWLERMATRTYARLMQRFVAPSFPEHGLDVVMFGPKVARQLNAHVEAHSSVFLQILTMGFRQSALTYVRQPRTVGQSRWTLARKAKLFIDSFVAFSFAPIRFVSLWGLLLATLGLVWAGYIVVRALVAKDLSPGWPSLVAFLMIGAGVTNISLGIIAEYLWRTLDATRRRPAFVIDEVADLASSEEAGT